MDERGSKIAGNRVFDCHLPPVGRQMAIENSVSNDFWSASVDSINVFDCRLPGVIIVGWWIQLPIIQWLLSLLFFQPPSRTSKWGKLSLFYTKQWTKCISKTNKSDIDHEWNYMISITSNWYQLIFSLDPFLDYLWFFHLLNAFHFRTSNADNFLICERKHQVWLGIYFLS